MISSFQAVEDFKVNGVDVQQKLKEIAASDVNWVSILFSISKLLQ